MIKKILGILLKSYIRGIKMIKMIPPYIKEDYKSNAEKKIFALLENSGIDCTVLHSIGLSEHRSKVFGEIDFVIISNEGILCLEVKGGRVYRQDGVWYYVDKDGKETGNSEGPFQQVIGGMYSLRDYMKKHFGYQDPLVRCQYACGVMFPDIIFKESRSPDIINEIVFDDRFTDDQISAYIKKCFVYWREKCKESNGYEGLSLSNDQIKKASDFLRGNFGTVMSLESMLNDIDNQLVVLTEEQYNIFEMLDDNHKVVIKGGAGTGKTLMGMEYARRLALKDKTILYLCFNKPITQYLRYQQQYESTLVKEKIHIVNFHELLTRVTDFNGFKVDCDKETIFKQILPEKFLDWCMCNEFPKYDVLIIDEGQDLLRINYILCFDELLKGGLAEGNWCILYDPNQNIYNEDFNKGLSQIKTFDPTNLNLNINCRNTRQIGTYNALISGIKSAKFLKVSGEDVIREGYDNKSEVKSKLTKLIKNLKAQGANLGDVVILSPYSFERSSLEGENIFKSICSFQNITGLDYNHVMKDYLKFSTIHSFKGMESKIIILIDIDKFDDSQARLLNYVAISRARTLLYLFHSNEVKEEMFKVVNEGMRKLTENS
jgi:hypothetical protein